MKNFSMIHDLSGLSEPERQEYLKSASEYLGLDSNLNALDLIWMDGADGKRRLIAYARRGTTDILRGIHGINVLSITKEAGAGYVSFTAVGKNRDGRQEIAVGAAAIEGLKGDRLAAAVATAQTRALRRLTLQFCGTGLLDESELNETTTDINRMSTSLASQATLPSPQPAVTPNNQPGKDVTEVANKPFLMTAPAPFSSGSIVPGSVETVESLIQIKPAGEPAPELVTEGKTRRRRRTKAEMEAANFVDSPADSLPEKSANGDIPESQRTATLEQFDAGGPPNIHPGYKITHVGESIDAEPAEDSRISISSTLVVEYPTKEQEDGYRERLKVYTNQVLKDGGMTDGIIWRVRKYTMNMFPEAVVENGKLKLTCSQWDTLLNDFNQKQKTSGPRALVAEINLIAEKVLEVK